MTDFPQALPQPNPFKCDITRHLWRYGLALAIYQKVGQITRGGQGNFFTDTANMAEFFGANKVYTRRMFAVLNREGFLVVIPNPNTKKAIKKDRSKKVRRWVSHAEWATLPGHADKCIKVDELLMPWSADADPFAGKLWGAFEGKIRMYETLLIHARSTGCSDDEIVAAMREAWVLAKARRATGDYQATAARTVFFATIRDLHKR